MKNYINEGKTLTYTATADIVSGQAVRVGTKIGVAVADIANGATGTLWMDGVFELPKKSADTVTVGAALYWDNSNGYLTTTSTDNTYAGYAVEAAGNGATKVKIRINR